jgi:hypothetical protein
LRYRRASGLTSGQAKPFRRKTAEPGLPREGQAAHMTTQEMTPKTFRLAGSENQKLFGFRLPDTVCALVLVIMPSIKGAV